MESMVEDTPATAPEASPNSSKGKTRKILLYPDQRLRRISQPVETVTDETRALIDDMAATMVAHGGGGLAAPQIDVPLRVVVLSVNITERTGGEAKRGTLALVNPKIIREEGMREVVSEGCLSLPGIFITTHRPTVVKVSALGYDGKPFELQGDGLLALALSHELEHLDGKLMVDQMQPMARDVVKRKMEKAQRVAKKIAKMADTIRKAKHP